MNRNSTLAIFLICFFILSGTCPAQENSLLFEQKFEYHGKGIVEYALPAAVETNYQPQMVAYWISEFTESQGGEPAVVLEVILYGSENETGRNTNRVVLTKGESCLVFSIPRGKDPIWTISPNTVISRPWTSIPQKKSLVCAIIS